jgi:hypothetical protein
MEFVCFNYYSRVIHVICRSFMVVILYIYIYICACVCVCVCARVRALVCVFCDMRVAFVGNRR